MALLVRNEEFHLVDCLRQFDDFADEIIVGVMPSVDNTRQIANALAHKVIEFDHSEYLDQTKNVLIGHCTGEYVLLIDADERVTDELKDKLKEIAAERHNGAVEIPRRMFIKGKRIKGLGWQNDAVLRFFKNGTLTHSKFHHTVATVNGDILKLPRCDDYEILHFWAQHYADILRKINYYAPVQAEKLYSEGVRFSVRRTIYCFCREFLSRYIRSWGFLNGSIGFIVAVIMGWDRVQTLLYLEKHERND